MARGDTTGIRRTPFRRAGPVLAAWRLTRKHRGLIACASHRGGVVVGAAYRTYSTRGGGGAFHPATRLWLHSSFASIPRIAKLPTGVGAFDKLLHAVLHYDVAVGGAGGAAGGGGLHGDGQRCAGRIILRDGTAIVGRGADGEVNRRSAISEPDDGVGGAATRRGFRLHLQTCNGDGFVRRPSRASPRGRQCPGQEDILLATRACAKRFAVERHSLREVLSFGPILLHIELRERMQISARPVLGSRHGAE